MNANMKSTEYISLLQK